MSVGTGPADLRATGSRAAMARRNGDRTTSATAATTTSTSRFTIRASMRSGPRDHRVDGRAVELLDPAVGERTIEDVHRYAHDLALVLAQVGDRVDLVPLAERKADGDLVDDVVVQEALDLVERPEVLPAAWQVPALVVEEAANPQSEFAVVLQFGRERLGPRAGADHQDVAQVVATCSQPHEGQNRSAITRRERDAPLGREQDHQVGPADIGQLEHEQEAEREQAPSRRSRGRGRNPRSGWSSALVADTGRAATGRRSSRRRTPRQRRPAGSGTAASGRTSRSRIARSDTTRQEEGGKAPIHEHQQRPEPDGVSSNHRRASLDWVVRRRNGTGGLLDGELHERTARAGSRA